MTSKTTELKNALHTSQLSMSCYKSQINIQKFHLVLINVKHKLTGLRHFKLTS